MKKKNHIAASLKLKQYSHKVIKSKKIYNRKKNKDRYEWLNGNLVFSYLSSSYS